ncbi:MAG: phosphodiester glycosidase family protein [Pseudomonadota bacterium]
MWNIALSFLCSWLGLCAPTQSCRVIDHLGAKHTVCSFDMDAIDVALHLDDAQGRPYRRLSKLEAALPDEPLMLMNGGMYHDDLGPVGLYVADGQQRQRLSRKGGWGNFHLLPNGVFWGAEGTVGVTETKAFAKAGRDVDFATQSGPMLVIDGKLHPRFIVSSDSLKIRNGVGVAGRRVHFAMSHGAVNFHDFGTLFRDVLQTPNALFLDGTVSELRAPGHRLGWSWKALGPMIAVTPRLP